MDDVDPTALLFVLAGYLSGSFPSGLVVGKLRGVDLRQHGSGNIGATNAGRVLGRRWFYVVFACDFLKSFVPVLIARSPRWIEPGRGPEPAVLALATGVAAVLGHVFPVFLKFRGGKGVATAAGVFTALAPVPTAIALVAWLVVAKASGYVSLASLAAAAALPLACWLLPRWFATIEVEKPVRWAALAVALLIVLRHRGNISRLLRGEEPRRRNSGS